jgi:hypothetical protein
MSAVRAGEYDAFKEIFLSESNTIRLDFGSSATLYYELGSVGLELLKLDPDYELLAAKSKYYKDGYVLAKEQSVKDVFNGLRGKEGLKPKRTTRNKS